MSKYYIGLKTRLQDGLSEPEYYGDLVYEFRKKKVLTNLIFRNNLKSFTYYKIDIPRQTACMFVNQIMVDNFAPSFNCTTFGRSPV